MATPEGKVKLIVKRWLKKHNLPHWSIIPSTFGGSTGMSDLCGILPSGKWLAIEVKAFGKKKNVTKLQQKFIDTINENNGIACVVACQDDLDVLEYDLVAKGELPPHDETTQKTG